MGKASILLNYIFILICSLFVRSFVGSTVIDVHFDPDDASIDDANQMIDFKCSLNLTSGNDSLPDHVSFHFTFDGKHVVPLDQINSTDTSCWVTTQLSYSQIVSKTNITKTNFTSGCVAFFHDSQVGHSSGVIHFTQSKLMC